MRFELFIAARYLRAKRRQAVVGVITAISVAGVAAGVASLIVALVLGAAAVIAAVRGNGVFGIFAANHVTEIVWGAAAVLLFVLSLLPRVGGGRRVDVDQEQPQPRRRSRIVRARSRTRVREQNEYPERSPRAPTPDDESQRGG